MKKILFILFLTLTNLVFSQKVILPDTSRICFPYDIAKKIAKDLNSLDSLKELIKLTELSLEKTNEKVDMQQKVIETLELKCDYFEEQIKLEREKFSIIEEQNNDLRKEVKKQKVQKTFTQIVGGVIITTLTTLLIIK